MTSSHSNGVRRGATALRRLAWSVLSVAFVLGVGDSRIGSARIQGTGAIFGRVLDAASKRGIAEVVVTLNNGRESNRASRPVGAWPPSFSPWSPTSNISRILTDSDGRFVFGNLPGGAYLLSATASRVGFQNGGFIVEGGVSSGAYLNAEYGQHGPNGAGETIELTDGQRLGEIEVRMWPAGSIDGMVTDETGEPLAEVVVGAVRTNGNGDLINGPTTKTDDRGLFHLSFLAPGDYYVFAPQTHGTIPAALAAADADAPDDHKPQLRATGIGFSVGQPSIGGQAYVVPTGNSGIYNSSLQPNPAASKRLVYPTTFYPSVSDVRSALRIALDAGEHRDGIDVVVRPVEAATVSGHLFKAGRPVPYFGLHLVPGGSDGALSLFEVAYCVTDANGRFEFPSIPSGQFKLLAFEDPLTAVTSATPGDAGAWAVLDVAVRGKNIEDLSVTLNEGFDLRGKIRFQEAPLPENVARGSARISMPLAYPRFRRSGLPASSRVGVDGSFGMIGVSPGRYIFTAPQIPGWFVASVFVGGREFGDRPFEVARGYSDIAVTYSRRFVGVMGSARVPDDVLRAGVTAYLFPADRTVWSDGTVMQRSFQAATVSKSGLFQFADVPAGDYLVVATDGKEGDRWIEVDHLARTAGAASRVRIEPGRTAALSLSVVAGR